MYKATSLRVLITQFMYYSWVWVKSCKHLRVLGHYQDLLGDLVLPKEQGRVQTSAKPQHHQLNLCLFSPCKSSRLSVHQEIGHVISAPFKTPLRRQCARKCLQTTVHGYSPVAKLMLVYRQCITFCQIFYIIFAELPLYFWKYKNIETLYGKPAYMYWEVTRNSPVSKHFSHV